MFPALFLKQQRNILTITLTFITIIIIYLRLCQRTCNILEKITYQVVRLYNIALQLTIPNDNIFDIFPKRKKLNNNF